MGRKILFDINDFKTAALKAAATTIDSESKKKYRDNHIDEKEAERLQKLLNGNDNLKRELANESDDIKKYFGWTENSIKAESKDAQKQEASKRDEVFAAFNKARGYDEQSGMTAKTLKEAYKEVKEQFTDKKKYTKEERKEYEKALKEIKKGIKTNAVKEKGSIMQQEVERIQKRVYEDFKTNTDVTDKLSYDDVINELTGYAVTSSGKYDKRLARTLKGRHGNWFSRAGRGITATVTETRLTNHALTAVENVQAIKNKKYTLEELSALLGEENKVLIEKRDFVDAEGKKYDNALEFAKLITKDKDGKYDISKLSDLVLASVGKDYTRNDHDETKVSETTKIGENLGKALRANAANKSISVISELYPENRNEAMAKLSDSLGFYNDEKIKRTERMVQKVEKEAVKGAIIGSSAAASVSRNTKTHQDQMVEIPMEGYSEEEIDEYLLKLAEDNPIGSIAKTAGGILIHQEQMVKKFRLLEDILCGGGIGALVGGALGYLEEMGKHSREFHALVLDISCCDLNGKTPKEQLEEVLGMINDKDVSEEEKSRLRTLLLLGYQKDSKGEYIFDENCNPQWDCCTFQNEFKKIGGNLINNALETKIAGWDAEAADKQIRTQQEDCSKTPIVPPAPPANEQEKCDVTTRGDINFKESNKYGWKEIIQMFYSDCLKTHTEKEIRFAIRKANNIPNNLPYVPANLLLPYQLFEGEDECTRTKQKDVKAGKYDVEIVKTSVKTPDGQWQGGIICKKADGRTETTWLKQKYKSQADAEAAARAVITQTE